MNRTSVVALTLKHHAVIAERHVARAVAQEAATIERRCVPPRAQAPLRHAQHAGDGRHVNVAREDALVGIDGIAAQPSTPRVKHLSRLRNAGQMRKAVL
jgi:hypothetical protein